MADRCCCPIELEVMESPPLEWGLSEYIPMETSDLPEYEGAYTATPSWQEQTLATSNRVMREDFEIEAIVKLEVINESGGLTLTI